MVGLGLLGGKGREGVQDGVEEEGKTEGTGLWSRESRWRKLDAREAMHMVLTMGS